MDDPDKRRPFLQTPFREGGPAVSPDGHWSTYVSDESGRSEVYVRPYPGPGQKWTISTDGGSEPIWPRKSGQIFYRNADAMMVVGVTTTRSFLRASPDGCSSTRTSVRMPIGPTTTQLRTVDVS